MFRKIAFLAVSILAANELLAEEEYSYRELKRLILDNEEITSVDVLIQDFADRLPDSLRSRYLLMKNSGSLQEANHSFPRIILFTDDAKLILAVAGKSSFRGSDSIEVIQYNDALESFDFFEVQFTGKSNRVVFHDGTATPRPTDCVKCHGDEPRPNFNPYLLWPNAYGALDDKIRENSPEKKHFANFLENAGRAGRYELLLNLPNSISEAKFSESYGISTDLDIYSNINSDDWNHRKDLRHRYRSFPRANYKFTQEIGRLNIRRWAAKLLKRNDFSRIKHGIAASIHNCYDPLDFVPGAKGSREKLMLVIENAKKEFIDFRLGVIEATLYDMIPPTIPFEEFARRVRSGSSRPGLGEETFSRGYEAIDFSFRDYDVAARLRYLFSELGESIDLRNMGTVHSVPGFSFTFGNSGLQRYLRQALVTMGGLEADQMYWTSLGGELQKKCQGR